MLRDQIKNDVLLALRGQSLEVSAEQVELTRTQNPKFGDFTTNVALKIAHESQQDPQEVAKKLADSLGDQPYIKRLEVAGPGFINFFVGDKIWQDEVEKVLKEKGRYGSNILGKGKKARVEFVSANPTGPLHFGNARGGPIGDVLASVLEFSGYSVLREFYANDIGGQVNKLGLSILNVARGGKLEDQEYKGEYIAEFAKKFGDKLEAEETGRKAVELILAQIEADCRDMGIKFDMIYEESQFIADGRTKRALDKLDSKKVLKKKEGATWFAPSDEFLKDRETVVIKSDGSYTYFANDIAYHELKFSDGYDLVFLVIGANHHGHIPRLQAAISALGFDVSRFRAILYQWVRFKKGQQILAMSKRSGNFITTREILDMVGRDALRFFILMHDASSHIDFDLDLAREKSSKNPVYYVQYACARIHGILASSKLNAQRSTPNYGLLTTTYELELIKEISKLPELVEDIAGNYSVHQLTTYAMGLADSFHKFYENCQVLPSEALAKEGADLELTTARLALCEATKIALENTLKLLGVSAPEKM
ncbi:MAG: arginine--tRNA ligase [Candidatus Curtissbacteria bacterium]